MHDRPGFDGLGAVRAIEGFFLDRLGLGPWEVLILMQLSSSLLLCEVVGVVELIQTCLVPLLQRLQLFQLLRVDVL